MGTPKMGVPGSIGEHGNPALWANLGHDGSYQFENLARRPLMAIALTLLYFLCFFLRPSTTKYILQGDMQLNQQTEERAGEGEEACWRQVMTQLMGYGRMLAAHIVL